MTQSGLADLHVHTTRSDGSRSVRQVMEQAFYTGIRCIAITDHDTMAGVTEASELGKRMGIRVIPGAELSTRDEKSGRSVHMLCYLPENPEKLKKFMDRTLENRKKQKLAMMEKLTEQYPFLTKELVLEYGKDSESIYECHIMQPLCDWGYTGTAIGSLMSSLISSKGSCYVPSDYPTTEEAAEAIKEAGGLAVVAHAEQFDSFELVERYAKMGLIKGVEVYHPRNSQVSRERLLGIAKEYHLFVTGGSDFHGQYAKNPHPLGTCGCTVTDVQRMLEVSDNFK